MDIYINTLDIKATYGVITNLEGIIGVLMKPAKMKKYIENKNAMDHGKEILSTYAKVDERTLQIPLVISATNIGDYYIKYNALIAVLQDGLTTWRIVADGLDVTMHLAYEDCQTYVHYNGRWGKMIIKLVEPNPKDRQ